MTRLWRAWLAIVLLAVATGGRNVIRSRQGATRRNAEMLLATLARKAASRA